MAARTDRASAASVAIPITVQRISYAALRPNAITAGLLTGQNERQPHVVHLTALNLDTWALTAVPDREPAYPISKR